MNRLLSLLALLAFLLLVPPLRQAPAQDQEPMLPIPRDQWDLTGLLKGPNSLGKGASFELSVDSIKYDGKKDFAVILSFPTDHNKFKVINVQQFFQKKRGQLHFHLKDGSIQSSMGTVSGNIIGNKGDTFRLVVPLPDNLDVKTVTRITGSFTATRPLPFNKK